MDEFYNNILHKNICEGQDLVEISKEGVPHIFLTKDLQSEDIGMLDGSYDTSGWTELPPELFLPIIKASLMQDLSCPGATSAGQVKQKMRIYDTHISKCTRKTPDRVRRVVDLPTATAMLRKKTIKFTPPTKFNDFQEGFVAARAIRYSPVDSEGNPISNYFQLIDKFCVSCFAEGPWNNLALSLYGDMGKGILFVFDAHKLEMQLEASLLPVTYTFEAPFMKYIESDNDIVKILQNKHIPWEYEKEFRFVIERSNLFSKFPDAEILSKDNSLLIPFDTSALCMIMKGPKFSDALDRDKNDFQNAWETFHRENPHVRICTLNPNPYEYNSHTITPA